MRLVDWIIKMNSDSLRAEVRGDEREFLERRANLMVVGINLAVQIKRTMKTLLMMYEASGQMMQNERIRDVMQGIEMLKAIEVEFKTKKYMIN